MQLKDLQETIGARLGARDDLDDAVRVEFRLVQRTVLEGAEFKPWFLLSEASTAPTSPGEARVPLPHDFLREYDEGGLYLEMSEATKELLKRDVAELKRAYKGASDGEPSHYAVTGDYIRLFPTPAKSWRLRMMYYRRQPVCNEGEDTNDWLRHAFDVALVETALRLASYNVDYDKLQEFQNERSGAWHRLMVEHEAREHSGRGYQMGRYS